MSVQFPAGAQLEEWSRYPEVIDLASRFYTTTISGESEYVAPIDDHFLETSPGLGLIIVRKLFKQIFVEELVNYADQRKFRTDEKTPDRDSACIFAYPGMKTGIGSIDFLTGLYFKVYDVNFMNIFLNKYYSSRQYRGYGEPHIDDKTEHPPILLGKGSGFLEISSNEIEGMRLDQIDKGINDFLSDSYNNQTHKIYFSDGDVVFFDGRRRIHRGSASSCNEQRYSVVAHKPKVKVIEK